jgi:hypothetical protein
MKRSYGERRMSKPEGMLREIYFPTLCLTDVATGDGRKLSGEGGGTRDLPLTLYAQFTNDGGHSGAVISGSLDCVVFEDDGNVSGWGWVLDDDNGHQLVKYRKAGALQGNSVDLADCKVNYEYDFENDDLTVLFEKWNVAASTIVGKPAFGTARYELPDDEVVAAWMAETDPLVMDIPFTFDIQLAPVEVTADGAPKPSWDMFHVPEPAVPTKTFIGEPEADGYRLTYGHLALWESCHDGYAECLRVPRPTDNYSSFNQPGVLTDRGLVETGPIFFLGGHPDKPLGDRSPEQAYGGIENAWGDVRIVPGRLGPWFSGYVRPGVDEAAVIAARASRVSGHWKGDRLKAIVSVNCEGYAVTAGFSLTEDGHVDEMVASFPVCLDDKAADDSTAAAETETDSTPNYDEIIFELEMQDLDD